MSFARRAWHGLRYVAIVVVAGLLLLEAQLQLIALVVRPSGPAIGPEAAADRQRILCLGDSNTYGLFVERSQAYPAQLEALWNASGAQPEVEVLNLGFPGTSSSAVLRDYDRLLDTLQPDIVILLVGANDFWTLPALPAAPEGGGRGILRAVREHSRVLKLFRILRSWWADAEPAVVPDEDTRFSGEDWTRGGRGRATVEGEEFTFEWRSATTARDARAELRRNLGAIADRSESRGVELVLTTYASRRGFYGYASEVLVAAARERGLRLVDVGRAFAQRCPQEPCEALLFPDSHPRPAGYAIVARMLLDALRPEVARAAPAAGAEPATGAR